MDPFKFDESFQRFQQSMNQMNDMANSFVMNVMLVTMDDEDDVPLAVNQTELETEDQGS